MNRLSPNLKLNSTAFFGPRKLEILFVRNLQTFRLFFNIILSNIGTMGLFFFDLWILRQAGCRVQEPFLPLVQQNLRFYGFNLVSQYTKETRFIRGSVIRNASWGIGEGICPLIASSKVRRLQGVILERHFSSQFGIKPSSRDLNLLSFYASLPWISTAMTKAAGCSTHKKLTEQDLYRCRVVYPAFLNGLKIYLNYQLKDLSGMSSPLTGIFYKRKIFLLKRKGFDTQLLKNLYPKRLDRQQLEAVLAGIKELGKLQLYKIRMLKSKRNLKVYFSIMNQINKNSDIRIDFLERLLLRLERKHS